MRKSGKVEIMTMEEGSVLFGILTLFSFQGLVQIGNRIPDSKILYNVILKTSIKPAKNNVLRQNEE